VNTARKNNQDPFRALIAVAENVISVLNGVSSYPNGILHEKKIMQLKILNRALRGQ